MSDFNIGDTVQQVGITTPMTITELFPNMPGDADRPPLYARCEWTTEMTMRNERTVISSTVLPLTELLKV